MVTADERVLNSILKKDADEVIVIVAADKEERSGPRPTFASRRVPCR
ncbi:MAG: hypothetical protein U0792_03925 [Gemmataceae bacterium]